MIKVETGMMRDLGTVCSLEIKSQEYPLPQDAIKCYIDDADRKIYMASIQRRKVGCTLIQLRDKHTIITRVSVDPNFRNIGVGKSLMHEIEKEAWKAQHGFLRIYIPSYKIDDPLDPDYIGWWTEKNYFKAMSCEYASYFRYGKWWDAYVFERPL